MGFYSGSSQLAMGNINLTSVDCHFCVNGYMRISCKRRLKRDVACPIPAGIPGWFVPFMFVIEVFLLFVRCVALAMRLFANMIAGHIVITAFLGLCVLFGVFAGILAFPMAVVFYCMEIFVCLLQAFIFVFVSSSIFIG